MIQNAVAAVEVFRNPREHARETFAESVDVTLLVEQARAALGTDLDVARACLDQISNVLTMQPTRVSNVISGANPKGNLGMAAKGGLAPWQIRRICRYIDEHLTDAISLRTLSEAGQLSSGHLCRAFKISMGVTPLAYVQQRRIERAQAMMLGTEESLSQIASACGLSDQSHLTRLFRQHVGQTPLAWRRSKQRGG